MRRLDALARALAAPASRRAALGAFAGSGFPLGAAAAPCEPTCGPCEILLCSGEGDCACAAYHADCEPEWCDGRCVPVACGMTCQPADGAAAAGSRRRRRRRRRQGGCGT